MKTVLDPVDLTAKLVRCPSVTPAEAGALSLLGDLLLNEGFECRRVDRNGIPNLFAKLNSDSANTTFGFNGHTDVVPPGNPAEWRFDPFSGRISDGRLWGRGAADMKSGVAAFVAASVEFARRFPGRGAIVLTITGDEEGIAKDGTEALLDWMAENGERMDACLVAEPTCSRQLGDAMKIGRRGSVSFRVHVEGEQGHSAYPDRARNPVAAAARLADRLTSHQLDRGSEQFDPSCLSVTSIETGNSASNVIPAKCRMMVNIRFNDRHTKRSLLDWVEQEMQAVDDTFGVRTSIEVLSHGDAFVTVPGKLTNVVSEAVRQITGREPEFSTGGGTSDARFIRNLCQVVEFGLLGATIHRVDEHVEIEDIRTLTEVYFRVLDGWFD